MRTKEATLADQKIGARVRARRMVLGMSQEALGEAIGLTFQQVQKYEKGANRIGGSRMIEIAAAMNCPVSYFFGDNGGGRKDDALDQTVTLLQEPNALRLLKAFHLIEGSHRMTVVKLAESLAKGRK